MPTHEYSSAKIKEGNPKKTAFKAKLTNLMWCFHTHAFEFFPVLGKDEWSSH